MSFSTVYVLFQGPKVVKVAISLDPQTAIDWLKYSPNFLTGELYACHMSDSAAVEVSETCERDGAKAAILCRRYSHSMMKCADLT